MTPSDEGPILFLFALEAQIPISLGFAFDILRIGGDVYDCFRPAVLEKLA